MARSGIGIRDFYTEVVLPSLAQRLDVAFPEFGWRRDARGWIATNEEYTHARLGVRAERVVAHGPAPRGFLVHGGESILWTAYLSGGAVPRGDEFINVVRQLAERAGVDASTLDRPEPPDRRAELLESFAELCARELMSDRGASARDYLIGRGLSDDEIRHSGLGLVPEQASIRSELSRAGYRASEITSSGVVTDSRWTGRVSGPWRNERGHVGTLWARAIEPDVGASDTRYLYLKGASRSGLPPYGMTDVLNGSFESRRELVLVEGFFDLHQLRTHGFGSVAALGGLSVAPATFERLASLGVEHVTFNLDGDAPGIRAAARAIEQAGRAQASPSVYVVDPGLMGAAKDPDALVRAQGIDGWTAILARRECGVTWRARAFLDGVSPESPAETRREALRRAGTWLGQLPARLALEQEDAIRATAERCGYSQLAVGRAFRARFWNDDSASRGLQRRGREAQELSR
jgi:DNA primase